MCVHCVTIRRTHSKHVTYHVLIELALLLNIKQVISRRTCDKVAIVFSKMAKIKMQKKKKVVSKEKLESEEVALPSTRKSDDPIPNKVQDSKNVFSS